MERNCRDPGLWSKAANYSTIDCRKELSKSLYMSVRVGVYVSVCVCVSVQICMYVCECVGVCVCL